MSTAADEANPILVVFGGTFEALTLGALVLKETFSAVGGSIGATAASIAFVMEGEFTLAGQVLNDFADDSEQRIFDMAEKIRAIDLFGMGGGAAAAGGGGVGGGGILGGGPGGGGAGGADFTGFGGASVWESEALKEIALGRLQEFHKEKFAIEIEAGEQMTDLWLTQSDSRVEAETRGIEMIMEREQELANFKKNLNASVLGNAIGFLNMLGQKNKAAAIAGIVVQKGIALNAAYTSMISGSQLAFASQLVPGDPTSIARAEAARNLTLGLGAANMALIAASGFMQANAVGGGGGGGGAGGGGTFTNPVVTQPVTPEETSTARQINITVMGNIVDQDKFARELVPSITRAIQDGAR
jgi:phosphopantetheine adenylyltransferase